MAGTKKLELLEDPRELATFHGWSEEVYCDFLMLQDGTMTRQAFRDKYLVERSILTLDLTGFTETSIVDGQICSLLRIFDAQKVCAPIFKNHGAHLIHAFADDLVALFDTPDDALDAAFEVHRSIAIFNDSSHSSSKPAECCIGLGYGKVYAIGPNLAQGDEMNKSSKLGEDIARGGETLVTENFYEAVKARADAAFSPMLHDDMLFPYFLAEPVT